MTLTPGSDPVKPNSYIWTASLCLVTVLVLLLFINFSDNGHSRQDQLGQLLADNLATHSVEAFVAADRIQLGILSNRSAAMAGVRAVRIMGADESVLAEVVNPIANTANGRSSSAGTPYRAPVRLEDSVVGFVEINLIEQHLLAALTWRHWLVGVLLALALPWLGQQVLRVASDSKTKRNRQRARVATVALNEPAVQSSQCYTLMANLQHSTVTGDEALAQTLSWAEQIAHLYGAAAELTTDGAVLISFGTTSDSHREDRAFAVIYAALLLARCLSTDPGVAGYRLGLHFGDTNSAESTFDLRADALLLAAGVGNGQLAVTQQTLAELERPHRVLSEPFQHPLHDELSSAQGELRLVTGLSQPYMQLLDEQLQRLTAQLPSTDSLSTF